jgi:hypothetical protein
MSVDDEVVLIRNLGLGFWAITLLALALLDTDDD